MPSEDRSRLLPTRRGIISGAAALALTAGPAFAERPSVARGHVFHDRSGTGRRRAGDPGISGVMVSNGRDVVLTDSEGRWRLPLAEGDSVFVIKPPLWAVPAENGVPAFSRLHCPQGSPIDISYRHAGVAPTGALPDDIDFPLRRQEERSRFEVALLADTQPEDGAELAYLRDDIVAAIPGSGAVFGINHGDIVFDDLSLYPRYLQVLSASGIPWHHCPGNHDINPEARDDRSSRDTWKRVFGPRHYAFQYAGATFILLDNVHYFGHNPGMPDSGRYCGRIGEQQQLQFVRNVLAKVPPEQLVVLSMHIPLRNYQNPASAADNTGDRRALLQLLSSRPHTLSFSGHMHSTEHHYLGADDGFRGAKPHHHHVLTAASGGWWGGPKDSRGIPSAYSQDGTPNGFHVLAIEGSACATSFVPAAGKSRAQLRAIVDGPHCRDTQAKPQGHGTGATPYARLSQCELIVNVFDGGPQTRVTYELSAAGSEPIAMERAPICDPFVARLFSEHAAAQKPWVRAVPSSHVWKAALPSALEPGAHCVTVKAEDEYGRWHCAHHIVEVTNNGRSSI